MHALHQRRLTCHHCTGGQVWAYAHGVDERQVEPPKSRKSVGAECNWGIRFQNDADAVAFMDNLAGELSTIFLFLRGLAFSTPMSMLSSTAMHKAAH